MIQHLSLEALHPAEWNPRLIRDKRFKDLCASLRADPDLLERRPILANLDGEVYAGNMRYRAAQHLGWSTVPAILDDVTPEQAKARAIRDNQSIGEWVEDDYAALLYELAASEVDLSTLGADQKEIERLLASVGIGGPEEGPIPEPPAEPITRPGDLWLLGPHRLLCGDATRREDVERLMGGQRVALMATDPPYLVDYSGGNHPQSWANRSETRDKHWDSYREADGPGFFHLFLQVALQSVLTENPALYQWHAFKRQAMVEAAWVDAGLLVHQQIIWVKARSVLTRSHFMWQHEPCFYGWIQGKQPSRKPPSNASTVWSINQQGESDDIHPTQKPRQLFADPISWHVGAGEGCYEPFAGSGTQFIAAHQLGRVCYGLEIDASYCDVIVTRWENLTGDRATRERVEVAV